MSRSHRKSRLIGKPEFGSGVRKHKVKAVLKDRVLRQIKRGMVSSGMLLGGDNRPPYYQYDWVFGELSGTVYADCKSKARALIKKNLGIPAKWRLPWSVDITRLHNPQYQQALNQIYVNLQASS